MYTHKTRINQPTRSYAIAFIPYNPRILLCRRFYDTGWLDLSNNQLTGRIPAHLGQLTKLGERQVLLFVIHVPCGCYFVKPWIGLGVFLTCWVMCPLRTPLPLQAIYTLTVMTWPVLFLVRSAAYDQACIEWRLTVCQRLCVASLAAQTASSQWKWTIALWWTTFNALCNTLFLIWYRCQVYPAVGHKVTPCATFGPLRNSERLVLFQILLWGSTGNRHHSLWFMFPQVSFVNFACTAWLMKA